MVGIAETATLNNLKVSQLNPFFFMKLYKILLALTFFFSISSFGQATGNTLTVMDVTGTYVYWEHNFTDTGGNLGSSGPGAPIGTPIKIKMSSMGSYIPTFYAGDLHGNCDSYQTGSMNVGNTEFTTTLNSCCPSTTEVRLSNGLRYPITIPCAAGGTTPNCITYAISTVCEVYCISFFLPSWAPQICRNKNYTVVVGFTDGTSTTIIVNFNNNNTTFCFTKPINNLVSSTFGSCDCGINPYRQANIAEPLKNRIEVAPNPARSVVWFKGDNLEQYTISIFDTEGKPVLEGGTIDSGISLEKQRKGVYVYVITDDFGYRQDGKIIKE